MHCDVRVVDDVRVLASHAIATFGHVDLVANNAGIFSGLAPMWELDRADWLWNIEVNFWGVVNGIVAFVPHLVDRGRGHVINTASMAGLADVPFNGPYNAAKHAVVALSETLRNELDSIAPGIGVTVVCPGQVATNIQNAERNRPPELARAASGGPAPVLLNSDEGLVAAQEMGSVSTPRDGAPPTMADPLEFAHEILAAVEADRLHCVPDAGSRGAARARVAKLLSDLDAYDR
jgi:NAD(P)-dependent dehydrogenase (short-subunit alcohol dehydrogenase family)